MSKVAAVMYHYVRDLENSRYPEIKGLGADLFRSQIEFLIKNYKMICMEDLIAAFQEEKSLPENAALLTFDDGYIDHYHVVFPILDEYQIQGSFFVPTSVLAENKLLDVNKIHFILACKRPDEICDELYKQLDEFRNNGYSLESNEVLYQKCTEEDRFDSKDTIFIKRILQTYLPLEIREKITEKLFKLFVEIREDIFAKELYLDMNKIKCMKRNGMFFGVHGHDHIWLGNASKEQMQNDISTALSHLSGLIDKSSWVMNYPYGSWNHDVVDFIRHNGCKLGFITEVGFADLHLNNSYLIPRLDTNDFPPKSRNYLAYKM